MDLPQIQQKRGVIKNRKVLEKIWEKAQKELGEIDAWGTIDVV